MKYPLRHIGITQYYHQGLSLDFGWALLYGGINAPIYAVDDATVYGVEVQPAGGNVIFLKHDDGKCSAYGHLSKVIVKKGDRVKLGQQIGNMGNTGTRKSGESMPYHLHFALFSKVEKRYGNSDLDPFKYLEVYEDQHISNKTLKNFGSKLKYHKKEEIMYVNNVDYEGLVVRKSPGGANTGKVLKAGTRVVVEENQGYWSKIGENEWVWSLYLSKTCPKTKVVFNVKNPPLNVRNAPNIKTSKIIAGVKNGDVVQVYKTKNNMSKISPKEEAWVVSKYLK